MYSNGSGPLAISSSPPREPFASPSSRSYSFDPWSRPSPTKQQQQPPTRSSSPPPAALNNSLFSESEVPPLYSRLWSSADPVSGFINLSALDRILSSAGIQASAKENIIQLVAKGSRVARQEFYVAIALAAFAQTYRELSIEEVYARKDNLPIPSLPNSITSPSTSNTSTIFSRPPPARSGSDASLRDPWNTGGRATAQAPPSSAPGPMTSTPSYSNYSGVFSLPEEDGEAFGENLLNGSGLGYGSEGWELGPQDKVHVSQREELGGWLLQHTVWIVRSDKHGTLVERRYSDFVWLLECLTRRYPFRLLPSLPPKRPQISGRYLAADDLFLERRRRGLERFMTFTINHPVLKQDALVGVFLSESGDLAIWRKHSTVSLVEESYSRTLTASEESSLPLDLEEKLSALRSRILPLVEHWTKLTSLFDRIAHRRQNQGADWCRLKMGFESSLEAERSGWRTVEVEGVEEAQEVFARGVGSVGGVTEDRALRCLEGVVEDVKRHRELYLNMRDLFGRHVTLSPDAVDKLKKRVESNMRKLEVIREVKKPGFEVELDKLASTIEADQSQIDVLLRRRVFIRYCLWQELLWLFRSTSLLKASMIKFTQGERTYAEELGEAWGRLGLSLN